MRSMLAIPVAVVTILLATPSLAQTPSAGTEPPSETQNATPQAPAAQDRDPERDVNLAQPDFALISLPTSLRVPRHRSAFRVTHRFGRPLGDGDFGDLLADLFGLDSGAQIGLEYRFGLFRGTQIGIHRTSDRTIQFFAQYDLKQQSDTFPLGIAVLGSAEGTNNYRDSYSPGIGVIISREFSDRAAVYVEPIWIDNTNDLPEELVDDNDTFIVGLGVRVRIRPSVYLVVEGAPRAAGFSPGIDHVSFGIEKRVGGHLFQLNFSRGIGTTYAQIARGGFNDEDWFIGFNISRKFF